MKSNVAQKTCIRYMVSLINLFGGGAYSFVVYLALALSSPRPPFSPSSYFQSPVYIFDASHEHLCSSKQIKIKYLSLNSFSVHIMHALSCKRGTYPSLEALVKDFGSSAALFYDSIFAAISTFHSNVVVFIIACTLLG